MTVGLAATWNPRGELARFTRLLPLFAQSYAGIAICVPPVADRQAVQQIRDALSARETGLPGCEGQSGEPAWKLVESQQWSWGRHLALQTALEFPAGHIQYADMDRLLRWIETRPQEWRATVDRIESCDCLIVGRTPEAYATHPRSLVATEALSNRVVSYLLGREMDVSAGSKGFSRAAAAFILANSAPGRALGADGSWPVLAQRGDYRLEYVEVDGLDWESADRYQEQAAGADRQRQLAAAVDGEARSWSDRVEVAQEIVECALEAAQQALIGGRRDTD